MEANKAIMGMAFLIALAVLLVPVQASINTPTVSFDNTQSYTTGTSVTVGVTVSGASASATISRLNLKEVNGLTVSDPAGGEYTNFVATTSGTTKNFVVTAGTAGTYKIKAYALEQQATTVQESETDYITFIDPSVLRVSVDNDPNGTYTGANQPFFLQIKIRNPLDTSVTTSMNLSFNSNAMNKSSGDPTDDTITIPPHQTFIANWSFLSKSVSGSPYTATVSLGGETAHTAAFTINPTPPGDGDGVTGGGGGADGEVTVTLSKSWAEIEAGEEKSMTMDRTEVAPTLIKFQLKERKTSVEVKVATLSTKPATIAENVSGEAYKYFDITTTNIQESNLESAKIRFRVNNTWISDNYIDMNKVYLYRYANNSWNKLTTTYVSRDENYTHYEAVTPGFSTFVVAGEKVEGAPICTAGEKRCSDNDLQQCKSDGSTWEKLETCGYGCNETTLACTIAPEGERVCTAGAKRCVGDTLQECKADESAWITSEACGHGCNSTTLSCNPEPPEEAPAPSLLDYWWVFVIIIVVILVAVFLYLKAQSAG